MSQIGRLIAIADRMAAILQADPDLAADPTITVQRLWSAPVKPAELPGRNVWIFAMHYEQSAGGTRAQDWFNYYLGVGMTETVPADIRGFPPNAWIDERLAWFGDKINDPFSDPRRAAELWGPGFENLIPVTPTPSMPDVVVTSELEEKRLLYVGAEFTIQEV